MRGLIPALVIAAFAAPAGAAERTVQVGSFTRVRVEAPVTVTIAAGPPRATVSGDTRAIEALEVRADSGTLVIRRRPGTTPTDTSPSVALSTPDVAAVIAAAGARVTATGLRAPRLELALAGSGSLDAREIDAGQLVLVVAGNGQATLTGRAATARLIVSGAGAIDAGGLVAGDLTLSSDGAGETRAAARYTAVVNNTGAGMVTVLGTPRCTIRASARGPVRCGKGD